MSGTESLETNGPISIFDFIKQQNYANVLGSWFQDIWFPTFYKKDIIITIDILRFIYKKYSDTIINYKNFLIKNEIEFTILKYYPSILNDFPYLDREIRNYSKHILVQKTWLRMTYPDFKESIMMMKNKPIHKSFIAIEKLLFDYTNYIHDFKHKKEIEASNYKFKNQLMLIEKENTKLRNKVSMISNIIMEKANFNKGQVFYITTTSAYAKQNIFKIGGLEHRNLIKPRETGNTFYYLAVFLCHDYKLVQHLISSFLFNFRLPNNDTLFRINFSDLIEIVTKLIDQLGEHITYFNTNQERFIDNLTKLLEPRDQTHIKNYENGVLLDPEYLY